jgi:GTP diphosphokinase / guanosine-3',5'-bis(diphosphate) 3'-diphosphatase
MKIEKLMENLPSNYGHVERELVIKAYSFADKVHYGLSRASIESNIAHCVSVAAILSDLKVPPSVVIAGILHDVPEVQPTTLKSIETEFGQEIGHLVEGVYKLSKLPKISKTGQIQEEKIEGEKGKSESQPVSESVVEASKKSRNKDLRVEIIRKTFIAMSDDIRVVLIRLADQLHTMRTLGYLPEEIRIQISKETLDIFAPLANRLGLWQIKWELEDLAFRYENPEKYREIAEKLSESREEREIEILKIHEQVKTLLKKSGIEAEISGRPKHIYSIYRKMIAKSKPFELVRDLRGIRIIVHDVPTCYSALGVIHTHWRPIPQEFDDYIAAPKDNFYQSLHTAVIYDDGKPLEFQIRTFEMNQSAEYGIAAHWRYKEDGKLESSYQQRINWLRKLMEWRQEVEDDQEFVDGLATDVFEDRAYAFTPRGDIIDLPIGSTPIDFAYHVHTEIGHRCRGAKINGKLVTLDYTIKTGDQVSILTAKQGGPSRDWLNKNLGLVKTQRARSKIKQWFKRQDYEQNMVQGKAMFEKELLRLGITDIDLESIVQYFDYKITEDMYAALGCGDISIGRIINKISEILKPKDILLELHAPSEIKPGGNAVTVLGLKGLLTSVAHCCNPAPGDDIIGYITRGRGVTIHRKDCPNVLTKSDKERLIKVAWGEALQTYPVSIQIKAYDRQGLMGDISLVLNAESINVVNLNMKTHQNLATVSLIIEVSDIDQLSRILSRLENIPNVLEAHRIKPG